MYLFLTSTLHVLAFDLDSASKFLLHAFSSIPHSAVYVEYCPPPVDLAVRSLAGWLLDHIPEFLALERPWACHR